MLALAGDDNIASAGRELKAARHHRGLDHVWSLALNLATLGTGAGAALGHRLDLRARLRILIALKGDKTADGKDHDADDPLHGGDGVTPLLRE